MPACPWRAPAAAFSAWPCRPALGLTGSAHRSTSAGDAGRPAHRRFFARPDVRLFYMDRQVVSIGLNLIDHVSPYGPSLARRGRRRPEVLAQFGRDVLRKFDDRPGEWGLARSRGYETERVVRTVLIGDAAVQLSRSTPAEGLQCREAEGVGNAQLMVIKADLVGRPRFDHQHRVQHEFPVQPRSEQDDRTRRQPLQHGRRSHVAELPAVAVEECRSEHVWVGVLSRTWCPRPVQEWLVQESRTRSRWIREAIHDARLRFPLTPETDHSSMRFST